MSLRKALQDTPLAEVRRRAAIVHRFTGSVDVEAPNGAERFAWSDGAGQSAVWYFLGKKALLLTFDHESQLNHYAGDETGHAHQMACYAGLPDDLMALLVNQPENYESLNIADPVTGNTVLYAGGVFWHNGRDWGVADGLVDFCDQHDIDLVTESGFDYCVGEYLFDEPEFTPEAVIAWRREEQELDVEAEEAAEIRAAFVGLETPGAPRGGLFRRLGLRGP